MVTDDDNVPDQYVAAARALQLRYGLAQIAATGGRYRFFGNGKRRKIANPNRFKR
jgi:hypothetical protein